MVRVLVVDDSAAVRHGLTVLLDTTPDLQVVASCADGSAALAAVRRHDPDVVLMDVSMPDIDGITATGEILAERPAVRVVILTSASPGDAAHAAASAGAVGFQSKSGDPAELVAAIRTVAAGGTAWSGGAREALRHHG